MRLFMFQIKSIKGIGPKSYEQCIGFLRIYPDQLTGNSNDKGGSKSV